MDSMQLKALKFLFLTLAMLSLAFSAVAACACKHHQSGRVENEPLSCHSQSHDESPAEAADIDPETLSFGEQCSCYARNFEAAIIAKSESKKAKAEDSTRVNEENLLDLKSTIAETAGSNLVPFAYLQFDSRYHSRSGPSRAPPRL